MGQRLRLARAGAISGAGEDAVGGGRWAVAKSIGAAAMAGQTLHAWPAREMGPRFRSGGVYTPGMFKVE